MRREIQPSQPFSVHTDTGTGINNRFTDSRVNEMKSIRRRFAIVAYTTPVFAMVTLSSSGVKQVTYNVVIHYVEEYYTCLLYDPSGLTQCPKKYLDYQYPGLAIAASVFLQGLAIVALVFVFSQKNARIAVHDILIKPCQRMWENFQGHTRNRNTVSQTQAQPDLSQPSMEGLNAGSSSTLIECIDLRSSTPNVFPQSPNGSDVIPVQDVNGSGL